MKVLAQLIAAVLAIGCGAKSPDQSPGTTINKPVALAEPADNCTTSDDCELVDACCGCSAGGRKLAIRKDAVAGFVATRKERCSGQMCPQMMSDHPSCDAEAVCGNRNRCRVAPHMQHQ